MQHKLVQQLKKRAEVLTVVKERIFTTSSCNVSHTRKEHCSFKGVLGLLGLLGSSVKVWGEKISQMNSYRIVFTSV